MAVGDGDAGGFLASVLLGEEPEVRQTSDVLSRGPDPEQTAFVFGTLRSHLEGSLPRGVTSIVEAHASVGGSEPSRVRSRRFRDGPPA